MLHFATLMTAAGIQRINEIGFDVSFRNSIQLRDVRVIVLSSSFFLVK